MLYTLAERNRAVREAVRGVQRYVHHAIARREDHGLELGVHAEFGQDVGNVVALSSEDVPSVVELRGGDPVSELSQTVVAATSGAAVAMVV